MAARKSRIADAGRAVAPETEKRTFRAQAAAARGGGIAGRVVCSIGEGRGGGRNATTAASGVQSSAGGGGTHPALTHNVDRPRHRKAPRVVPHRGAGGGVSDSAARCERPGRAQQQEVLQESGPQQHERCVGVAAALFSGSGGVDGTGTPTATTR
jgi:hypothetical protein